MPSVDELLRQVEKAVLQIEDVSTGKRLVANVLGVWDPGPSAETLSGLYVYLTTEADRAGSRASVAQLLRQMGNEIPGIMVAVLDLGHQPYPARRRFPLSFTPIGPDLTALNACAARAMHALQTSGTVTDVFGDLTKSVPRVSIHFDADSLARHGVTRSEIQKTLQVYLGSATLDVQNDFLKTNRIPIKVKAGSRSHHEDLLRVMIRNASADLVPLAQLADVRVAAGPSIIFGQDGKFALTVSANPMPGVSLEEAAKQCRPLLEQIVPDGYKVAP